MPSEDSSVLVVVLVVSVEVDPSVVDGDTGAAGFTVGLTVGFLALFGPFGPGLGLSIKPVSLSRYS